MLPISLMKGDEVVEAVKLPPYESLLLHRRHPDFALQQLVEEEVEPDAALLKHFDLLHE